jgi:proteasome lid subunit RPN8/RPN11
MLETLYNPSDTDERCGLILTDGSIVEIENIAEDKTDSYDMSPEAVLPFLDAGTIAGTWHTHPGGDPNLSGADYSGFLGYPELEHNIVGIRDGKITVTRWRVQDGLVVACD